MKLFLVKGVLLLVLNGLLSASLLKIHGARLDYAPWETDSILLTMPKGDAVDLVILGSSHAYLMSRFEKNFELLESGLKMRTLNMALPTGGGIRPARYYLEHFVESGGTAPRLLYVLVPFVFFSV